MKAATRQYKFINSQTGNVIYYHTLNGEASENDITAELDKIKAQVAIQNGLFLDIVYWEKIKKD